MSAFNMIPIRTFNDNYIWTMRDATRAAVVDPGDAKPVIDYFDREGLALVAILNTHHYADHVGRNGDLLRRWKVPVFASHDDRIADATQRLAHSGMRAPFQWHSQQMYDSLERLAAVPDTTRVYCGHEYTPTYASPKRRNLAIKRSSRLKTRRAGGSSRACATLPTELGQEKHTHPFPRVKEPEIVANASRYAGRLVTDPVSVLAVIRDWKNNF